MAVPTQRGYDQDHETGSVKHKEENEHHAAETETEREESHPQSKSKLEDELASVRPARPPGALSGITRTVLQWNTVRGAG